MGSVLFDKCCCCVDLRIGCLILGYLQLVGEIIYAILIAIMFGSGAFLAAAPESETGEGAHTAGALVLIITSVLLLFLIVFLGFTIALLKGLHQGKRGHILAYLIYASIFMAIYVIMFVVKACNQSADGVNASKLISDLFSIALSIYFMLVIKSYYHKLGENNYNNQALPVYKA